MFYISLPYFYQNKKFNQFFSEYVKKNQNKLKQPFFIDYCYGSFPWSYWNGGKNNNYGQNILFPEMVSIIKNYNMPICIDWSNCFLSEQDFCDIHEKATIKASLDSTYFEISDLMLLKHINKNNLNNKIIFSNSSDILYKDISFDNLVQQDYIYLSQNLNTSLIEKVEINIGGCYNCPIQVQEECTKIEQASIYSFSEQSKKINCIYSYENKNYYDLILPFLKKGYTHFRINTNYYNLNNFNLLLINSFIKEEFIGDCLNEYLKI